MGQMGQWVMGHALWVMAHPEFISIYCICKLQLHHIVVCELQTQYPIRIVIIIIHQLYNYGSSCFISVISLELKLVSLVSRDTRA